MRRRPRIPGLSFSWRRALGISQAQARLSRQIGVPLSRAGRQRKIGAASGGLGVFALIIAALLSGLRRR